MFHNPAEELQPQIDDLQNMIQNGCQNTIQFYQYLCLGLIGVCVLLVCGIFVTYSKLQGKINFILKAHDLGQSDISD